LQPPRAGLFVTCLVDLVRPSVGFAAARLIEAAGCTVVVPETQTCCGQPAYNSGDPATSRALALQTIRAFAGCDYVVVPSGSCAAMLKIHYPRLFTDAAPEVSAEVAAFSARVHELCAFLADVRGLTAVPGRYEGRITYHDACSGLRELGIKSAPRRLVALVPGAVLAEMTEPEACCGFGGLFSETYAGISNAIVGRKVDDASQTHADLILSGDIGCLMTMAGKLAREGRLIACRHVAEVLAGELADPPIGRGSSEALRGKASEP
jgi:L-lactate dehydrogenase complex protein LldE